MFSCFASSVRPPRGIMATLLILATIPAASANERTASTLDFDERFTGRSLRWDYFHSGTAGEERFSLDRFRLEGAWPGSRHRLIDDTNLGKYLFEMRDAESGSLLYSRGFASIFGEWKTTGEAGKGRWRTFHESQRMPEPKVPVRLLLLERNAEGHFRKIHEESLDPASRFVDRSALPRVGSVREIFVHGPSAAKVDLLVIGDGYSAGDRYKFHRDVRRLTSALFETEPFRRRKNDFNLRMIFVPSYDSGISDPRRGEWKSTALGLSFNAFDSDRYVLTYENADLREIAAQASYDTLMVIFNNRKYGGGGIFNLWATSSADTEPAAYVFIHEFGHSFAGLADEYYSSQVAYEDFTPKGSEPWEPNITALLEPDELKWKDLVAENTPLPTPWDQAAFDEISRRYQQERKKIAASGSDEEMEALFRKVKAVTAPLLDKETYAETIGAFEGAGYQAKGLYRPAVDCIMFTRNPTHFCPVCSAAIEKVIDLYTR